MQKYLWSLTAQNVLALKNILYIFWCNCLFEVPRQFLQLQMAFNKLKKYFCFFFFCCNRSLYCSWLVLRCMNIPPPLYIVLKATVASYITTSHIIHKSRISASTDKRAHKLQSWIKNANSKKRWCQSKNDRCDLHYICDNTSRGITHFEIKSYCIPLRPYVKLMTVQSQ